MATRTWDYLETHQFEKAVRAHECELWRSETAQAYGFDVARLRHDYFILFFDLRRTWDIVDVADHITLTLERAYDDMERARQLLEQRLIKTAILRPEDAYIEVERLRARVSGQERKRLEMAS